MDTVKNKSPQISKFEWGKVEVEDHHTYKDAKLFPGGSRKWDWNETGTKHIPGIQPADVRELVENDAEVIVLSKGINQRLRICQETEDFLRENGIDYFILQSEKAVDKYNELRKSKATGALIHSTC